MQHETMLMLILIRVLIVLHVVLMTMAMGPLDRRQIKNSSPSSRRTMYDVRLYGVHTRIYECFGFCFGFGSSFGLRSVFGIRYSV